MPKLSTLMAQSDPEKAGQIFSARELDIIKKFASAQAAKEATEAQQKMDEKKKKLNPLNMLIGAATGFVTSGGNPLAAVGGAMSAPTGKAKPLTTLGKGAGAGLGLRALSGGETGIGETLGKLADVKNIPNTGKYLKSLSDPTDFGQNLSAYKTTDDMTWKEKEDYKAKLKSEAPKDKTTNLNAWSDDYAKAMDVTSDKGVRSPGQLANSYYNLTNRAKSEGIADTDLVRGTEDEFVSKMAMLVSGGEDPTKNMNKLKQHAIFKKNPQLYSKVQLAGKEKQVYDDKFGGGWFGLGAKNPNEDQLVASFTAWARANNRKATDADYLEFLDAVLKGKADIVEA